MTGEMVRTILTLAITTLLTQSPAHLAQQVPWLTRAHLRWCLAHVGDCVPWDGERLATRELLERLQAALARNGTEKEPL